MTRETSRKAFHELRDSGALKGRQLEALEALLKVGPATSGEVIDHMGQTNVNLWRARFTELQARGLIAEVGTRACKVSGRAGVVWDYTGRIKPLDVDKGHKTGSAKAWKAVALDALELLGIGDSVAAVGKIAQVRENAKALGAKL